MQLRISGNVLFWYRLSTHVRYLILSLVANSDECIYSGHFSLTIIPSYRDRVAQVHGQRDGKERLSLMSRASANTVGSRYPALASPSGSSRDLKLLTRMSQSQ